MQIYLNQQLQDVQSQTISLMLQELGIQSTGIAIAVNNQVIPRSQWEAFLLAEGDKITIIRATQGG